MALIVAAESAVALKAGSSVVSRTAEGASRAMQENLYKGSPRTSRVWPTWATAPN